MTLNLDRDAINRANNASHFDAGDTLAREAERVYLSGLADLDAMAADATPEQTALIDRRKAEYRDLVEKAYNDNLRRRAAWMPVIVSGPAGYNCKRENAKADKMLQTGAEWAEKIRRFIDNTAAMVRDALPPEAIIAEYRSGKRDDPISADDPFAVEKLTAKRDHLIEQHDKVKADNAARRKAGKDPLPPWALALPLQEVRRLNQRISELTSRRLSGITDYNGFHVEQTAGRINLFFDDKPSDAARDILKGHGFRWAPSACVWTRKTTAAAEYSLTRHVLPALLALDEYAPAADPAAPEAAPEADGDPDDADDLPGEPIPGQLTFDL